ncbi:MAG TPA: hypothetical protein VFX35_01340 [Solirubrobacterales bacterium]|nr:hypothetical protein [Solirubrobacterales bacterium]
MTQPIPKEQVEVPEEALKQGRDACDAAFYGQGHGLDAAFRMGLQAAAPSIRAQERERLECCESCEDTGVYTEGMEWAPCGECFRGEEFTKLLRAHAKEVRQQERERVKEALLRDDVVQKALRAGLDVRDTWLRERLSDRPPGRTDHEDIVIAVIEAARDAALDTEPTDV